MTDRCQLPPVRPESADGPAAEALGDALRELPTIAAPAAIWPDVRARVDQAARQSSATRLRRRMPAALAASVLMLGVAAALLLAARPESGRVNAVHASAVATLLERSQRLEAHRRLPMLPPSGAERLLRARIGGIDASLNDQLLQETAGVAERRERLLRERVELMESLMYIERDRRRELVHQAVF